MFFLFDKLNGEYNFKPPFLDVGTGQGEFSLHLAKKGFIGDAIDISEKAINIARKNLKKYPVNVILGDVNKIRKKYNTLLLLDVIEHIPKDHEFIKNLSKKLNIGGYIIISVPNDPKEWGIDDVSYGHVRRYTNAQLHSLLSQNGIKILSVWDFTFPFFWIMRRVSLKVIKNRQITLSSQELTEISSLNPYWSSFHFSRIINDSFFWKYLFPINYLFRNHGKGHEVFLLGEKIK